MVLTKDEHIRLEEKARELRKLTVQTVMWAGGGHVGGSLSATDLLTLLYHKYLRIRVEEPKWEDRDRLIVSKGHIGVGLAPVLADKGFFSVERLKHYNHTHSELGMHLDVNKVSGLDVSTGSLGHGLSLGLGHALAARLLKKDLYVYCLLGDGECDEGAVWEAAMAASHYKATRLITFVDRNRCMIDGRTEDVMSLEPFCDKWRAFGFEVLEVDGHDLQALSGAIEQAQKAEEKPYVIVMNTYKGCGVSFMQDNYTYHYASLDEDAVQRCFKDIDNYHDKRKEAID